MAEVFLKILDIGIATSYLIGAIFILRLLLKRVPKTFFDILWCIVGIRLLFPVSITGSFSLLPDTGIESYSETLMNSGENDTAKVDNAISEENVSNSEVAYNSGDADNSDVVNNHGSINNAGGNVSADNPHSNSTGKTDTRGSSLIKVVTIVWAFGVAIMVTYLCISSLLLKRRLGQAVHLRENIYQSDRIKSSFVFGVIKPSIYLPFSLREDDIEYVIAHEKMHIRHRDYLVKIIGFLVLAVYWFLPTVWVTWILFCRDMEAFCDESVIRELGQEEKKNYATALLNCAERKEKLPVCPVAFGGAGMKERIKNVLNYKKSSFWVTALLILVAVILVICFVPTREDRDSANEQETTDVEQSETEMATEEDATKYQVFEDTTERIIETTSEETVDEPAGEHIELIVW